MEHLKGKILCEELKLSKGQIEMLCALNECPVMDFEISEALNLYPRSKMSTAVLKPLQTDGWIILHSISPNSDSGRPKTVWSLSDEGKARLRTALDYASAKIRLRVQEARRKSGQLASELWLEIEK